MENALSSVSPPTPHLRPNVQICRDECVIPPREATGHSCRTDVVCSAYPLFMKAPHELSARARDLAEEMRGDLRFVPRDREGYGGYWDVQTDELKAVVLARAASALGFLSSYAGSDSEWFKRAQAAWESKGDNTSLATGAYALSEILGLWAADVDRGLTVIPGIEGSNIRALASTDLMEQVRALVKDKGIHPAAPIVLAGAALEMALRGAVEEAELAIAGSGSISAYGKALRGADLLTKQEMRDVEQMSGLRNAAAHGEFEGITQAHASLMEQQVNLFLSRLSDRFHD